MSEPMTATEVLAGQERLRYHPALKEMQALMDRFCNEVLDMIIEKLQYKEIDGLKAELIKEAINAAEDEK